MSRLPHIPLHVQAAVFAQADGTAYAQALADSMAVDNPIRDTSGQRPKYIMSEHVLYSYPADCEVQIFSNGKLIQTLHGGGYYKFGELKTLKVFTKNLSIKMVGQPIMDGITIRPTFNTIITTHFRY